MKILKQLLILFSIICFAKSYTFGQANPFINVLPSNSGIVTTGGIIDIIVTIGNTGPVSTIPQAKLRPIIQVPPSVTFLPNAQQTGLPAGWTILSNTGSQLRVCNSTDPIPVSTSRIITLKAQGVTVTGPQTFSGNINFGNGTTCAAGTSVAGDLTTDNSALSTIEVLAGCNLGVTATAGTIVCNGDSTTITCNVTNATGAVEYNLSGNTNYQLSNTFTAPAGTYTVTAREVNNPIACITNTIIVITEPDAVPLTIVSIIDPTCTDSLGIVSITSDTAGLTFSVDGGSFNSYPATGYQLGSGAHSILAKNASNCSPSITSFTISAQPPTPLTPIIDTVIQPSCSISTGSVQLSNLPAGQWTINPGNISGNTTSTIINNLAAGNYSFNVTNSFGCTSSNAALLTINTVLGAPLAPTVIITQPTCAVSTGSFIITAPDTNLLYSIDGSTFSAYPVGGYVGVVTGIHSLIAQSISGCLSPFTYITIDAQPLSPAIPVLSITQPSCTIATGEIVVVSDTALTFSFNGAPYSSYPVNGFTANAGIHTLAVQNLSGCAPTVLNNIVINPQPQTPVINASATPITCFGDYSTITVSATGGVLPYEFSLNDTIFQSSDMFIVPAGFYRITIKDSNGCSNKTDTIFLTEPLPITGTVVASPIACHGDSSTLTISASGGVGAFEYALNSGLYQTSNSFLVPAGEYTVDIRLINNPACYAAVSPKINIIQPEKLKIIASYEAIKYCGDNTMINISANGGKPPYTGSLGDFIKGPGVWTFTVVDTNGCSVTSEITLLPPGCVELNVYPNPALNSISIDHSAAISTGAYFQIVADNGAKLLSQKVQENSFYSTIDISALARGVYLLVYINGDEMKVAKFTKFGK